MEWFRSYLSGRNQQVVIDGIRYDKFDIHFGLPKDSCLGPLLFSIYTSLLFKIVSEHLLSVHCYSDDTQLYLASRPDHRATQDSAVAGYTGCKEVDDQRQAQDLINDDKSEFILIDTRARCWRLSHVS